MRYRVLSSLVLGLGVSFAGCGAGDSSAPDATEVVDVGRTPPPKLDLLLVLDPGDSRQQNQLAAALPAFVQGLGVAPTDLRVAITTIDRRGEDPLGVFRTRPAPAAGPADQVVLRRSCATTADCDVFADLYGPGWECSWEGPTLALTVNDDGSVGTACRKTCAADSDCTAAFGVTSTCDLSIPEYTGCVDAPQTDGCPDTLGPVLDGTDVAGLQCLSQVDDSSSADLSADAGFKAALSALTVVQPEFLRDDAWLLLLIVTDNDDCSNRDETPLPPADWMLCEYRTEKLVPAAELAASLRALKADPGRVIVAGIFGDAPVAGTRSCLIPDRCLVERDVDACRCYQPGGDRSGCPTLLAAATPADLCDGEPAAGADADEELAYRLACVDACYGRGPLNPMRKCSKLVPKACGCYEHDEAGLAVNSSTPACQPALADEPAYRVACHRACYEATRKVAAVQPNSAPYLCTGPFGLSSGGARYRAVLDLLGDRGLAANFCDPRGVGALLDDLAARAAAILAGGN
jgi:hypothetical protein